MRACGQTDRQTNRQDEGNSRFCNFAKAPKNEGCANIQKMDTGQEMLKHGQQTSNRRFILLIINTQQTAIKRKFISCFLPTRSGVCRPRCCSTDWCDICSCTFFKSQPVCSFVRNIEMELTVLVRRLIKFYFRCLKVQNNGQDNLSLCCLAPVCLW